MQEAGAPAVSSIARSSSILANLGILPPRETVSGIGVAGASADGGVASGAPITGTVTAAASPVLQQGNVGGGRVGNAGLPVAVEVPTNDPRDPQARLAMTMDVPSRANTFDSVSIFWRYDFVKSCVVS